MVSTVFIGVLFYDRTVYVIHQYCIYTGKVGYVMYVNTGIDTDHTTHTLIFKYDSI